MCQSQSMPSATHAHGDQSLDTEADRGAERSLQAAVGSRGRGCQRSGITTSSRNIRRALQMFEQDQARSATAGLKRKLR